MRPAFRLPAPLFRDNRIASCNAFSAALLKAVFPGP
jgi:hypothetical protein